MSNRLAFNSQLQVWLCLTISQDCRAEPGLQVFRVAALSEELSPDYVGMKALWLVVPSFHSELIRLDGNILGR
jgi:hypothetical protein